MREVTAPRPWRVSPTRRNLAGIISWRLTSKMRWSLDSSTRVPSSQRRDRNSNCPVGMRCPKKKTSSAAPLQERSRSPTFRARISTSLPFTSSTKASAGKQGPSLPDVVSLADAEELNSVVALGDVDGFAVSFPRVGEELGVSVGDGVGAGVGEGVGVVALIPAGSISEPSIIDWKKFVPLIFAPSNEAPIRIALVKLAL
mmetsp:Transcript_5153/g.10484  ORF Transcript_5153/g.10484 Transcript_5153/m.10484 type:complete len:200 (-) Transcript_5153:792-1391(-)